jgi:hypothetical protein
MGQNFFPDTVNQTLLFPPSLHDWLPDGHLARFLVDVVAALDLSTIPSRLSLARAFVKTTTDGRFHVAGR